MASIHILGTDLDKYCFHTVAHNNSGKNVLRKNTIVINISLAKLESKTIAFETFDEAHRLTLKCAEFA